MRPPRGSTGCSTEAEARWPPRTRAIEPANEPWIAKANAPQAAATARQTIDVRYLRRVLLETGRFQTKVSIA